MYLTISFHLIVLIMFLLYSIHTQLQKETSFVLDFTAQEELERRMMEEQLRESVSQELDALIEQAKSGTVPRNVAVDVSKPLKDDRNKDSQQVYDEAEELQRKLDASRREAEAALDDEENIAIEDVKQETADETYSGPSVISWRLEGRSASYLPVPAYKCQGGGDVAVAIVVNRKGKVVSTKIVESVSSDDECMRKAAVSAAERSRFSSDSKADERQAGEIVYRFVAQ